MSRRRLTRREKTSRAVARKRARQKILHRVFVIALVCSMLGGSVYSMWAWRSGAIEQYTEGVLNAVYAQTGEWGMSVSHVYLEGRNKTPVEDAQTALGVAYGDPILGISLNEARKRLEALPWVKQAAVERDLPNTLHVRLVERQPVVLWQNDNQLYLMDEEGVTIATGQVGEYAHLPVIAGTGASEHVHALLNFMRGEPELFLRISSVVRVGGRRWNVRFFNGLDVLLPEKNPEASWRRLADLQREKKLLDRDIVAIDMRSPDRLFIRLSSGAVERMGLEKKEKDYHSSAPGQTA